MFHPGVLRVSFNIDLNVKYNPSLNRSCANGKAILSQNEQIILIGGEFCHFYITELQRGEPRESSVFIRFRTDGCKRIVQ